MTITGINPQFSGLNPARKKQAVKPGDGNTILKHQGKRWVVDNEVLPGTHIRGAELLNHLRGAVAVAKGMFGKKPKGAHGQMVLNQANQNLANFERRLVSEFGPKNQSSAEAPKRRALMKAPVKPKGTRKARK